VACDALAIAEQIDAKGCEMNPEHEERRKIIREWMSLSKEKRETGEQAHAFAKKVIERISSVRDPYRKIMSWLLPRTGRA
jgi:hypothetical protein